VPLIAGLEHVAARVGFDVVVAEQRPDPALEHHGELVLPRVAVQRRGQAARRERVLDDGETPVQHGGGYLVHGAEQSEGRVESFIRADDVGALGGGDGRHVISS